jgi:drug/metabolite transporter (DMT)-like permease
MSAHDSPQSPPAASASSAACSTLPLLAAAAAAACFVCMDATIKAMSPRFDTVQLATLRFIAGALIAWLLWARLRTPMPRGRQWASHLLRSALLLACLTSYFHSLTLLPLAQAVAMTYLAPICVAILAIWLLKERPSRWLWAALALGSAGVAVSLGPPLVASLRGATGGDRQVEGLLLAALSAVAFAGVIVLARQQARRDALWTILVVQNTLPLLVLLPLALALGWKPVATSDLPQIALVGVFATAGLLALTWAFTHVEASRAAPLEYTSFVWAALLGYTLFGEVPSATTWLSAGLIVAGCLLLLRR